MKIFYTVLCCVGLASSTALLFCSQAPGGPWADQSGQYAPILPANQPLSHRFSPPPAYEESDSLSEVVCKKSSPKALQLGQSSKPYSTVAMMSPTHDIETGGSAHVSASSQSSNPSVVPAAIPIAFAPRAPQPYVSQPAAPPRQSFEAQHRPEQQFGPPATVVQNRNVERNNGGCGALGVIVCLVCCYEYCKDKHE